MARPTVAEAVVASFPQFPHAGDHPRESDRRVEYRADGVHGCIVARLPRHRKTGHARYYGRRD
ncbi:MAG: hypothetical protein Q7S23_00450 [bacterium]|nr:hypothetical protein [bacterium]